MVLLRRIVRMAVEADGPPGEVRPDADSDRRGNGYGGVPSYGGWPQSRHIEVEVCCRGEADARTGYFMDIKAIDRAARGTLAGAFSASLSAGAGGERGWRWEGGVLAEGAERLNAALSGSVVWVRWSVTPTYCVEVSPMTPGTALLRQKFEIAAAHRLYVPELSDEENRRLFGRCANPSAHGHNYIIEPCVRVPVEQGAAPRFALADLERATLAALIEPFDHRNLNVDCAQFDRAQGGVNPSVENISRVFYGLLAPVIAAHGHGVALA
ncbi:MAG: 6-carboxytetrahydropterin synthase, partial [Phycisphaerales bacterium]|nr:6-carboxytetrahydropterin synthase [Phycisphaerales bacterium]